MSQKTNIAILLMVLSVPFALSQTRKAIPAGRYEVLSGIKSAHVPKSSDTTAIKDSLELFWSEVVKNIPQGQRGSHFFSTQSILDPTVKNYFSSKGAIEAKSFSDKVNIVLSDNLNRDLELIKKLKTKGSLVVLRDKQSIKEVLNTCSTCEVLVFQAESDRNYFLLRTK